MAHASVHEFDDWPDPVLLVSPDGQIRHVNEPGTRVFGYSYEEFIELGISNLAPHTQAERQAWVTAMYSVAELDHGDAPGVELTCVSKHGAAFRAYVTFEIAPRFGEHWRWVQIDLDGASIAIPGLNPEAAVAAGTQDRATDSMDPQLMMASLRHLFEAETALDAVAHEFRRYFEFDLLDVTTIDRASRTVRLSQRVISPGSPKPVREVGRSYSIEGTVAEPVLDSGSTQLIAARKPDDVLSRFPGAMVCGNAPRFLSVMVAPIAINERSAGMVALLNGEPRVYSEADAKKFTELVTVF